MRKISLAILIVFTTVSLQAQIRRIDTLKNQKMVLKTQKTSTRYQQYLYSIGINVFGLEQFPKVLTPVNPTKYTGTPLNGITFKFNDNQISYRLSGSFYNKNISFENECIDCEIAEGKLTDYSMKLGFEKNLNYSTIQPYFGFDLGFRSNRFKGSSRNSSSSIVSYDAITEKTGGVIAPVLGLKVNLFGRYLTIGAEGSMDIFLGREKQSKTYQDATKTTTSIKGNRSELLLRPVVAFVQFNFGPTD